MAKSRAERLISNAEGMDAVVIANDGEPFLDSTFWYLTEPKGLPMTLPPERELDVR